MTTQPMNFAREVLLVEDLTVDWLNCVLSQRHPDAKVTSVKADPPIEGMSVKHRLHIRYDNDAADTLPSTMVVKGSFGRQGEEWDWIYETEMMSYRDFLPTVGLPVPYTYFVGHEPSKGAPILLMEDLLSKGAKFNNIHSSLTYRQAAGFLDAFARYHAHYWNSEELREGGAFAWTVPLLSGFLIDDYFGRATTSPAWEKYLGMPRGTTLPRKFKDGARMLEAARNLFEFQKSTPWCIIHGDCHFGNTYLYPDGSPGFVDWNIKRGPWHQDFSYFLVSALDIVDRRAWERPLLEYYLSRLAAYGVTPPSFDEALLGYRCDIMYGLLIWICNGDDNNQYQREPINTGNTARFVAAALDHDTVEILS